MNKKLFSAFFAVFIFIFSAQAATALKGVVILVAQNQETYDKLSTGDKLYARSAFQSFVGNLTLVDDITVRTDANDASLRQVQKQSQIDASKGLGNEDSTYALDQGSKADLRIEVSLVKYKNGYKLEYSASNIETMQIVSGNSSDSYFELDEIDVQTDILSYNALKSLYAKGYISSIPYNVEVQLTHSNDTSENYAKYILDLTKQIEESKDELERLRKENLSATEKAEALRKEQALQLKIQAAESAKRKTEENLRKYQEELEKAQKQQAELKALADQKKNDLAKKFQEQIKQSQEQQLKLNKEITQGLSLEKRIELIEADRNTLADLESQLIAQIELNTDELSKRMEVEVGTVYAEPWRLAETDANGNPTDKARKYRESNIKKIREKYQKLIDESNNNLKAAFAPSITTYEKQINDGIKELEATEFIYRSYESGSQLVVSVGNYDGTKCNWTVQPEFNMKETDLITNIPDISLLKCTVSYKDITGKNPVDYDGTNDNAYAEYLDSAELADLCFRTSTPYIYGVLSLKVKYNSVYGDYRLVFNRFTLKKMENNKVVADYTEDAYNAAVRGYTSQQNKDNKQKEKEALDLKKKQEQEAKRKLEEEKRQEQHTVAQGLLGSIIKYWIPNMKQKSGITLDGYFSLNGDSKPAGIDLRTYFGGNGILYYGLGLEYDGFGIGPYSSKDSMDFNIFTGTSINFGCFRPYADAGIGIGFTLDDSSSKKKSDETIIDFRYNLRAGVDIVLNTFTLGAFYNYEGRSSKTSRTGFNNFATIGVGCGLSF